MRKSVMKFNAIAQQISRITSQREQLVLDAFEALELRFPLLAQILLETIGSRQRAACWMCAHQRAFDGRNANEVLADGDEDSVWDQIPAGESARDGARLRSSHGVPMRVADQREGTG